MLTNLLELLSNRKDIRNLMEIGREKKTQLTDTREMPNKYWTKRMKERDPTENSNAISACE